MGILMSAYVGGDRRAGAQEEAHEGVWYFLKNCLKGHLRNARAAQLTFGPGSAERRARRLPARYWRTPSPAAPMLGDVEDWDELQQARNRSSSAARTPSIGSIIDLSAKHAPVGNLLIQFHMGNMRDEHARKSMRLFASRSRRA